MYQRLLCHIIAWALLFSCHAAAQEANEHTAHGSEIVTNCQKRIQDCVGDDTVIENPEFVSQQRKCFAAFRCRGKEDKKRQDTMLHIEQERMESLFISDLQGSKNAAASTVQAVMRAIIVVFTLAVIVTEHVSSALMA